MNQNERFEDELGRRLRDSEAGLDARTAAHLRVTRREAIQTADAPGRSFTPVWATAFSAITVAVILSVAMQSGPGEAPPAETDTAADTEIYENLELLEFYENLEFYEWLAAQDVAGSA